MLRQMFFSHVLPFVDDATLRQMKSELKYPSTKLLAELTEEQEADRQLALQHVEMEIERRSTT